jgi:outer membrane protein assembly factor BamB
VLPRRRDGIVRRPVWWSSDGSGTAQARRTVGHTGTSPDDWPELHRDASLGGYAANSTITDADASTLGVRWALNLYSPELASPVVAYDSALNETIAYQGNDGGALVAVDTATGRIVWSTELGSAVRDTPLVIDGSVWVGTTGNARAYKVNATTGAVECSLVTNQILYSSPVAATPPGGVPSVYFGAIFRPGATGFVMAVAQSNCAMEWKFTGFPVPVAVWGSISYGVVAGSGRVLFGTSNPDQSVYELNALTGKEIWRFKTTTALGDYDIGSGITISPPEVNGLADGVAYVPAKDGYVYAVNLTTGALIWQFNMNADAHTSEESLSTAALDGVDLVLGCTTGIYDLNAVTGKKIWSYTTPGAYEVISSPAIAGPAGHEIVAFGDVHDYFRVLSLATGQELYSYRMHSWIAAGPAVSGGDILVSSNDGFLYDFRVGGGNGTPPTTVMTSPGQGARIANPNGDLTMTGSAADTAGVGEVLVGIREGGIDGRWWDAASSAWHLAPIVDYATLASPGATSTTWSFRFPVPSSGSDFVVQLNAVASNGVPDALGTEEHFFVEPSSSAPVVSANGDFIAPGSALVVTGRGFRAGESVELSIPGSTLGRVTASSGGTVSADITVPTTAVLGPASILVEGLSSLKASSLPVYIANAWGQLGGDASRNGFEANDPIIDNAIDPAQNILLDLAWEFSTGAATATAPAIVDDVAYVGDSAGDLYAVDVWNGKALWHWKTPTGKAITGAPAVDAAAGSVYVGAGDGDIYAVSTAGKLRWSANLGGSLFSPIYDGTTVYAASSNGRVASYLATTGGRVWLATPAATFGTSPALDPSGGSVVLTVPTASGTDVIGLNVANGSKKFTTSIGGSVHASPATSPGVLYVGSTDDDVYALSDQTGARSWSFTTGGPVQDTPALAFGRLVVGSDNGTLYVLNEVDGHLIISTPVGIESRGVVADSSTELAVGSNGQTAGIRITGDDVWGYSTGQSFLARPAVANGAFYASSTSGDVFAWTPQGLPPL